MELILLSVTEEVRLGVAQRIDERHATVARGLAGGAEQIDDLHDPVIHERVLDDGAGLDEALDPLFEKVEGAEANHSIDLGVRVGLVDVGGHQADLDEIQKIALGGPIVPGLQDDLEEALFRGLVAGEVEHQFLGGTVDDIKPRFGVSLDAEADFDVGVVILLLKQQQSEIGVLAHPLTLQELHATAHGVRKLFFQLAVRIRVIGEF